MEGIFSSKGLMNVVEECWPQNKIKEESMEDATPAWSNEVPVPKFKDELMTKVEDAQTEFQASRSEVKLELFEDPIATWSYEVPVPMEEIKTDDELMEDLEDTEFQSSRNEITIDEIKLEDEPIEFKKEGHKYEERERLNFTDEIGKKFKDFYQSSREEGADRFGIKSSTVPYYNNPGGDNVAKSSAMKLKSIKYYESKLYNHNLIEPTPSVHKYVKPLNIDIKSVHKLKPHKCPQCEYASPIKANLSGHIKSVHEKLKVHKCSYCRYICGTYNKLSNHIKTVHTNIMQYKCLHCEHVCGTKGDLSVHFNSVHEKLKPHKCPHCEFACRLKEYLSTHIKLVHEKLKPHKCPHCEYVCGIKRTLSVHIKSVHEKLKPHMCPHCEFASSYKYRLSTHIKSIHEKLKHNKCPHCEYTCKLKGNLLSHIKSVHENLKQFMLK